MSGHLFCIAHNHVNMNMIWHRKIDQFWRQKANLLRFLERIKKFQNSNIMIIYYVHHSRDCRWHLSNIDLMFDGLLNK